MPQLVTFWVLVGTVIALGVFFFWVIQPLVLPLFLGAVLAILCRPIYVRVVVFCRGRARVAALLTTIAVAVTVLVPMAVVSRVALREAGGIGHHIEQELGRRPLAAPGGEANARGVERPAHAAAEPRAADAGAEPGPGLAYNVMQTPAVRRMVARLQPYGIDESDVQLLADSATGQLTALVVPKTVVLAGRAGHLVLGFLLVLISLYYYLADGPKMLSTLEELTPLPPGRGSELFWEFERVCRAVVLGLVVTALFQGATAAIGFSLAGLHHVALLSVLTMVFSFVPFIGGATVWVAACIYLAFGQEHWGPAIFLAIWGSTIISGIDHLIKPYVIGGRANMHPLLVLVSVVGGFHLFGVLGVFIGPILAAVLFALLRILRAERERMEPARTLQRDEPFF